MGEYAKYRGQSVKIGTCEDMLYLRANQAHLVTPIPGNTDPVKEAGSIRFRFPFPQEDGLKPGEFDDPFFTLGVSGVEVPDDIDHDRLQFTRNYPKGGGLTLSTPCPNSKEGKASGLQFTHNGYSGDVQIAQHRLIDGKLVLVCACGGCGAKYRLPTLDDAQPVVDALLKMADESDVSERFGGGTSRGDYYRVVAERIVAGYCENNAWTRVNAVVG